MESAHHFSSRPDCNNTAGVPSFTLRTALSAIPFVSDLRGVDVQWFQETSSQAFAKFQGIVSLNDFRLSIRLQELLQAPSFVFPEKFLFLHGYAWIHWVAKSCTTTAYRWLFRDWQPSLRTLWSAVIKSPKFLHEVRLCQYVFCTGPFWFWSSGRSRNFGLSGSEYKHCVYPNPHFSQVLKIIHEKNLRVSPCVQELCHPQDSLWILAAIPVFRNGTRLPVLARGPHFFWFLDFGWFSQQLFWSFRRVRSHRSCLSTRSLDTIAGWWSIPHGSPRSCLSTLSLDTVEDVMVGEVDELEEDAGWSISCLAGVMDVEEGKLEEELVDKPGTTIGTMFSVLHCIRKPFLMRCGFLTVDPLVWVSVFVAKLS